MLVSFSQRKPLNLRHPRRQTLKFALPPTPTPNASKWNIDGVGPSGIGAGVGHVHFMFFVLISFGFCSQRKPSFQWNMGLRDWMSGKWSKHRYRNSFLYIYGLTDGH